MTTHTPHRRAQRRLGPSHTQVQGLRRPRRGTHTLRRFAASIAALALAATGAIAAAPGTAAADTHRDGQWYLDDFNIDKVHELSQGEGVKIGVIDSGIDANHPDLEGNIADGAEFVKGESDPHDDISGHGTAVASVLAGHGHGDNNSDGILGIAPKATIIPAQVDVDNTPHAQISDDFADALEYLVEQDVNIISVSMIVGSTNSATESIKEATNKGITVVAGAGNIFTDGDITHDRIGWPARATGVIPVTGTTQSGEFWDQSVTLEGASLQPQLGASAPATNIPVAQPDGKYDTQVGTSLAAPIVAGTLALIKSAYPDLGANQLDERLLLTVDDKGPDGFDDKYGWGIVNPYEALTATVEHHKGASTSKDDIVPLEEQGDPVANHPPDDTGPTPEIKPNPDDNKNEAAETMPSGPPTWLIITIVAIGVLLIAALIILVATKTRRNKNTPTAPGPPGTQQPFGAPGQQPPPPGAPQAPPGQPSHAPDTQPGQPQAGQQPPHNPDTHTPPPQ